MRDCFYGNNTGGGPVEFMNHKSFIWYARPVPDDPVELRYWGPSLWYDRSSDIGGTKKQLFPRWTQDEFYWDVSSSSCIKLGHPDRQQSKGRFPNGTYLTHTVYNAQHTKTQGFLIRMDALFQLLKHFLLLRAVSIFYVEEKKKKKERIPPSETVTIINRHAPTCIALHLSFS